MANIIQVCGDATLDWCTVSLPSRSPGKVIEPPTPYDVAVAAGSAGPQLDKHRPANGGAALTTDVLRAVVSDEWEVRGVDVLDPVKRPGAVNVITSWQPTTEPLLGKKPSYRCVTPGFAHGAGTESASAPEAGECRLLFVEDSGIGFRDSEHNWPEVMRTDSAGAGLAHVFLKPSKFADGHHRSRATFDALEAAGLAARTTVVVALSELRSCSPIRIGAALSWEQLTHDVARAVLDKGNPFVGTAGTMRFARVVITIGTAGVIMVTDGEQGADVHLCFDARHQEGEWEAQHRGSVVGYQTCISVGATWAAMQGEPTPDFVSGLKRGLAAARWLHVVGYKPLIEEDGQESRSCVCFPREQIADVIAGRGNEKPVKEMWAEQYSDMSIPLAAMRARPTWSMLGSMDEQKVLEAAVQLCLTGERANGLQSVPVEEIGEWWSLDRSEIEQVRDIRSVIARYANSDKAKPIGIVVSGPPGSGKSFTIREMAKSLAQFRFELVGFNLSQFRTSSDLVEAFHAARAPSLKGAIPIVVWDEFDCRLDGNECGWLRHFLAPLEDGEYYSGQQAHPTGRGVYVFTGSFEGRLEDLGQPGGGGRDARGLKIRDFQSRIAAQMQLVGTGDLTGNDEVKPRYYVKRALLVRGLLLKDYGNLFASDGKTLRMDERLIRAFLGADRYKHDVRSLKAIIHSSELSRAERYSVSRLPSASQLSLHVDNSRFMEIAEGT